MIFNRIYFKKIVPIAFISVNFFGYAQNVGIGTDTPAASALLDVDVSSLASNNKKGMLMPRVALSNITDIVTVANPATGLLVFNTTNSATDSAITANTYYFWNGFRWVDLATSETIRSRIFPQMFITGNTGNQLLDKTAFNAGTPQVVNFSSTATGAMNVNVGNRVSLANNNFRILSSGYFEIAGYVGYNPWVPTTCTTVATEGTCIAALDFIVQRSTDNGTTWVQIAKSSTMWGVGTGDRNRSVIVAPFTILLNQNDLVRAVVAKGSSANHGTTGNNLNIESGTGLQYSRLLRLQKIN